MIRSKILKWITAVEFSCWHSPVVGLGELPYPQILLLMAKESLALLAVHLSAFSNNCGPPWPQVWSVPTSGANWLQSSPSTIIFYLPFLHISPRLDNEEQEEDNSTMNNHGAFAQCQRWLCDRSPVYKGTCGWSLVNTYNSQHTNWTRNPCLRRTAWVNYRESVFLSSQ